MEPSVGTGAAALNSSVAPSSSAPTLSERSWTCIDLVSSSPSSGQPQVRSLGSTQDNPKVEQGTPLQNPSSNQQQNKQGTPLQNPSSNQQQNKQGTPLQNPSSNQQRNKLPQPDRVYAVPQSGHAKTIPTYLDEFKNGFPVDGLSSVSLKWWGTMESDNKDTLLEKESVKNEPSEDSTAKTGESDHEDDKNTLSEKERGNNEPSKGSIAKTEEPNHEDDQASAPVVGVACVTAPCNTENPEERLEGASLLSAIRKRNAEEGIQALTFGISRGYGTSKLSKRQKLLLSEIFRSSLPAQWRYSMS